MIVDRAGNRVNAAVEGAASQNVVIDNSALVSNATPSFIPKETQSGANPKITSLSFAKPLEDGYFNLYLKTGISFAGIVKDGVVIIQNKDFTKGGILSTGLSSETSVTGNDIHLDFTDLAGNHHPDTINMAQNNYMIGNEIAINFIV